MLIALLNIVCVFLIASIVGCKENSYINASSLIDKSSDETVYEKTTDVHDHNIYSPLGFIVDISSNNDPSSEVTHKKNSHS